MAFKSSSLATAYTFVTHQSSKMAFIGELPRYDSNVDDWQVYTERLEQFFEINEISDDKKKSLLISSISDNTYKTLRDLCHPLLPKNKTFSELIEILNKQFIVKIPVYRERCNFYNSLQFDDETILNWFARLKKLSVDCKFGDRFEDILLDKFISGISSSVILDRLCDENELTLQQAVDIAAMKESASGTRNLTTSIISSGDDGNADNSDENNQQLDAFNERERASYREGNRDPRWCNLPRSGYEFGRNFCRKRKHCFGGNFGHPNKRMHFHGRR